MDKKKGFFLIALVIVLVIGGAYLLYNKLGNNLTPNQLAETPNAASSQSNSGSEAPSSDPSSSAGSSQAEDPASPADPQKAPDFTVYDADGNAVKLSDFFGKPIILNFWSSRCGPCKLEMPDFQEAYEELGDSVQFLMVNMTDNSWDTKETASKFIEEEGYQFPVFFDSDQSAARAYGVYSLPTTFFIDANGVPAAYANAAINRATLDQGLSMILPTE